MVSDVWHCGPVFRAHTSFWFYMMGYFDSSRIFIVFASEGSSTTLAFSCLKLAMHAHNHTMLVDQIDQQ